MGEVELWGHEPLELFIDASRADVGGSVGGRRDALRALRAIAAALGEDAPDALPFDVEPEEFEELFFGPPDAIRWTHRFEQLQRAERHRAVAAERRELRRSARRRGLRLFVVVVFLLGGIACAHLSLHAHIAQHLADLAIGLVDGVLVSEWALRGTPDDLRRLGGLRRLSSERVVLFYDGRRVYLGSTSAPASPSCPRCSDR